MTARDAATRDLERARSLAEGLYPHQVDGVRFLLARRRAILADDMGLGKTRQSILAMTEAEGEGPFLVVCPASVKGNWVRELGLALGDVSVRVIEGRKPFAAGPDVSWTIINYAVLKGHLQVLTQVGFRGIVFDEAHYLKNHRSQRSRAARDLVANTDPPPRVHCLTGTPLTNRPRDLFPLLHLVNHPLGFSFLSFAKRYCDAYEDDYGWVADGASNIPELTVQLHGTMLRRRKEDVLDLPKKIRTWLPVAIPESTGRRETRRLIQDLMEARGSQDRSGSGEPPNRIALFSRIAPARKRIAIAKVKNTIEFVEGVVAQGEKVIVYSCFSPPSDIVKKHFGDRAVKITGKTPVARRQDLVDAFQNDDGVRVLAANIIAAGVGVNLTAARTVVFNDLDWVPANHWQAEDRAYRIGQEHPVNVYYFSATDTIEGFMGEVLEAKSHLIRDVVDGRVLIDGVSGGAFAHSADVLSELQGLVNRVSERLDQESLEGNAGVSLLLREAVRLYRSEFQASEFYRAPEASENGPTPVVTPEAIEALARALDPPKPTVYRIPATAKGEWHRLEVDRSDVACSCKGFHYRGRCRHSRELKSYIADGEKPKAPFELTSEVG